MSGQPKRRKMEQRLDELGGIGWLVEQVANGDSLSDIAADHFDDCSRHMLQRWIHKDPDREALYDEAQRESAGALVEEGKRILDTADEHSTAAVQKAHHRADWRKWTASRLDRPKFGAPDHRLASLNVVNIQELHLAALQALGGPDAQKLPEGSADVLRLESGDNDG